MGNALTAAAIIFFLLFINTFIVMIGFSGDEMDTDDITVTNFITRIPALFTYTITGLPTLLSIFLITIDILGIAVVVMILRGTT